MIKKQWSKRFRREVWGYACKIGGVRVRKFGFSTQAAAEVSLSKARVAAFEKKHGVASPDEKPIVIVTVKALVERRASQLQSTRRRQVSGYLLKRWLETLPVGLLVTELTTARLQEYVDARLMSVKPQTVFRELTDICTMLNNARDIFSELEGWTPPRRPRNLSQGRARARLISTTEAAALLTYLRRPLEATETEANHAVRLDAADLLQIALLTAARRSEILSLRWTDVNFEWRTLRITGTKTDRVRVIPMSDSLIGLLKCRRAQAPHAARVFSLLKPNSMLAHYTNKHFAEASEAEQIPYGRETEGGWVLHDARHTAITAMLHAGHSLESVMAISGHSARVMAMRYAHSTERTRRAAVSALDQFGGENVTPIFVPPAQNGHQSQRMQHAAPKTKKPKTKEVSKKSVKTRTARISG